MTKLSDDSTRRRGSPITKRRRVPLGIRISPEMREKLLAAAKDSGRSITQEVEMRLEQAFLVENLLKADFLTAKELRKRLKI